MFSGRKFQKIPEKEFLANEAHLNCITIRRFVLFDVPKDSAMRYLRSFIHKHTLNIILLHYA